MNKKIIILVSSIIIIGLIIGGIFYISKNNQKETVENKTETATNQSSTSGKSTVEYISGNKNISTFYDNLDKAGLKSKLEAAGPYTVFAANNDAFKNLPEGYSDILFNENNTQALGNVMSYHIAEASLENSNITNGQKIKTLNGQEILVEIKDGNIYLIDAKGNKAIVKTANIKTSYGVVHIIDTVLFPQ